MQDIFVRVVFSPQQRRPLQRTKRFGGKKFFFFLLVTLRLFARPRSSFDPVISGGGFDLYFLLHLLLFFIEGCVLVFFSFFYSVCSFLCSFFLFLFLFLICCLQLRKCGKEDKREEEGKTKESFGSALLSSRKGLQIATIIRKRLE